MMNRFLIICSIIFLESSCNNSNQQISDSDGPANTVITFIKWYSAHYDEVAKIVMVNNSDYSVWDSTKFYSVNYTATEKYLSVLKQSGFVGEKYLDSQRTYFLQCDSNFKVNPQNDGPPEGFDYDLVMVSQDYQNDLNYPEKNKIINSIINEISAEITFQTPDGFKRKYFLSKEKEKWMIDKIENL